MSLFSMWQLAKKTLGPLGPPGPAQPSECPNPPRHETVCETLPANEGNCEPRPVPSLDPLYTGTLTGKTPADWTSDGWLLSLKDRMTRADCPEMIERFRSEIESIRAEIEAAKAKRKRRVEKEHGTLLAEAAARSSAQPSSSTAASNTRCSLRICRRSEAR